MTSKSGTSLIERAKAEGRISLVVRDHVSLATLDDGKRTAIGAEQLRLDTCFILTGTHAVIFARFAPEAKVHHVRQLFREVLLMHDQNRQSFPVANTHGYLIYALYNGQHVAIKESQRLVKDAVIVAENFDMAQLHEAYYKTPPGLSRPGNSSVMVDLRTLRTNHRANVYVEDEDVAYA